MTRRNLIIAASVFVGAAALGGLFLLRAPDVSEVVDADPASPAAPGTTEFGDWQLICAPAAEPSLALDSFDTPDNAASAGQADSTCRIRHEARIVTQGDPGLLAAQNEPPRVILTVSLSLIGPARSPALMLRLPPTLTAGDPVTIRSPEKFEMKILARDCSEEECIAAGSLSDQEWDELRGAEALQIVFPIDEAQLVSVDVSTNGFKAAVAALEATPSPAP